MGCSKYLLVEGRESRRRQAKGQICPWVKRFSSTCRVASGFFLQPLTLRSSEWKWVGTLPFLLSCLKMVTFAELPSPSNHSFSLLPPSPALLLCGAPWQQAQPRAQNLVCVTWGAGWMQPEEEKKEYYLSCSLFGRWLHVALFGFLFDFYWRLEITPGKCLSKDVISHRRQQGKSVLLVLVS